MIRMRQAIDQGEAAAALTLRLAPVLGRTDVAPVAEGLEQRFPGTRRDTLGLAVELKADFGHGCKSFYYLGYA